MNIMPHLFQPIQPYLPYNQGNLSKHVPIQPLYSNNNIINTNTYNTSSLRGSHQLSHLCQEEATFIIWSFLKRFDFHETLLAFKNECKDKKKMQLWKSLASTSRQNQEIPSLEQLIQNHYNPLSLKVTKKVEASTQVNLIDESDLALSCLETVLKDYKIMKQQKNETNEKKTRGKKRRKPSQPKKRSSSPQATLQQSLTGSLDKAAKEYDINNPKNERLIRKYCDTMLEDSALQEQLVDTINSSLHSMKGNDFNGNVVDKILESFQDNPEFHHLLDNFNHEHSSINSTHEILNRSSICEKENRSINTCRNKPNSSTKTPLINKPFDSIKASIPTSHFGTPQRKKMQKLEHRFFKESNNDLSRNVLNFTSTEKTKKNEEVSQSKVVDEKKKKKTNHAAKTKSKSKLTSSNNKNKNNEPLLDAQFLSNLDVDAALNLIHYD